MITKHIKPKIKTAIRAFGILSLAAVAGFAQQQVNLTAGATSITMPDGTTVPMWGYSCGAAVPGSSATCAKSNPNATGWSPVVITVPTGAAGGLAINLTNNLTFASGGIPTSLTIVGQLGGGLGAPGGFTAAPDHSNSQLTTWPVSDASTKGTAPLQGKRVRSFGTEVAAGATAPL